jgi:hypothetical protein
MTTVTETAQPSAMKFDRMRKFTIEGDLLPILDGSVPLPNTDEVEPLRFLNNLAAVGHSMTPKWGWSLRHEGRDAGRKQWTQFFLRPVAMGGQGTFDGTGYAVIWGGSRYDQEAKKSIQMPVVLSFAICKHEKVDGAGARHECGWHPGSCKHCGLDMTVDSGD